MPLTVFERSYTFTEEDIRWLKKQPGVEEIKVETSPGDLILWDSRTIHWNRTPTADQVRVVVYTCYAPKSMASEAVLAKRAECFEQRLATTHWSVSRFLRSLITGLTLLPLPGLLPSLSSRDTSTAGRSATA